MNKKKMLGAALAAAALLPAAAHAQVTCPVNVSSVSVHSESLLLVHVSIGSGGGGWTLCNMNGSTTVNFGTRNWNLPRETCEAIYATLTTALVTGRSVALHFESATNCTPGDPNGISGFWRWASPFPINFELR